MIRKARLSMQLATVCLLALLVGCAAQRRTEGGQDKAFASLLCGLRSGEELNEGTEMYWADYGRLLPGAGWIFKAIDGVQAGIGVTDLAHNRNRNVAPPASCQDWLDLLQEAQKLGIIDKREFERTVQTSILNGRNLNYTSLKFARDYCPQLFLGEEYEKKLRRLRWDGDYYVYSMDDGLLEEAKKAIPRHQYYQELLRLCGLLSKGELVRPDLDEFKPIPWALRLARRERFVTEFQYKNALDALLGHFDKRLKKETDRRKP